MRSENDDLEAENNTNWIKKIDAFEVDLKGMERTPLKEKGKKSDSTKKEKNRRIWGKIRYQKMGVKRGQPLPKQ
jgi:hypothetical protein